MAFNCIWNESIDVKSVFPYELSCDLALNTVFIFNLLLVSKFTITVRIFLDNLVDSIVNENIFPSLLCDE